MGVYISCCYGIEVNNVSSSWKAFQSHHHQSAVVDINSEEEYCVAVKTALQTWWILTGLPYNLRRGLLLDPPTLRQRNQMLFVDTTDENCTIITEKSREEEEEEEISAVSSNIPQYNHERNYFYGLPDRPLYRELARRLIKLQEISQTNNELPKRILIHADELGLTELSSAFVPDSKIAGNNSNQYNTTTLPIPPYKANALACASWLRQAGESGVRELLGFRTTVGTVKDALPPAVSVLLDASRKPYNAKNKSNCVQQHHQHHPYLTVAARARAKHAHRNRSTTNPENKFFQEIKGSIQNQNEITDSILKQILREACWINLHIFGGAPSPVLEVRILSGYGARWAVDYEDDPCEPKCVTFRGFLEPQMTNGHEMRWRH